MYCDENFHSKGRDRCQRDIEDSRVNEIGEVERWRQKVGCAKFRDEPSPMKNDAWRATVPLVNTLILEFLDAFTCANSSYKHSTSTGKLQIQYSGPEGLKSRRTNPNFYCKMQPTRVFLPAGNRSKPSQLIQMFRPR